MGPKGVLNGEVQGAREAGGVRILFDFCSSSDIVADFFTCTLFGIEDGLEDVS
jgi:hypothetical protein